MARLTGAHEKPAICPPHVLCILRRWERLTFSGTPLPCRSIFAVRLKVHLDNWWLHHFGTERNGPLLSHCSGMVRVSLSGHSVTRLCNKGAEWFSQKIIYKLYHCIFVQIRFEVKVCGAISWEMILGHLIPPRARTVMRACLNAQWHWISFHISRWYLGPSMPA